MIHLPLVIILKAHKKDLLKHKKTAKYIKELCKRNQQSSMSFSSVYKPKIPEKTKIAELKNFAFISEHSAIQTINHLINIILDLDASSNALCNLKLHRTKCAVGQKKKRNTPIYFNTNYRTEMKLVLIIVDYCQLQSDALKFFLGVRLYGGGGALSNFRFFNVTPPPNFQ